MSPIFQIKFLESTANFPNAIYIFPKEHLFTRKEKRSFFLWHLYFLFPSQKLLKVRALVLSSKQWNRIYHPVRNVLFRNGGKLVVVRFIDGLRQLCSINNWMLDNVFMSESGSRWFVLSVGNVFRMSETGIVKLSLRKIFEFGIEFM